MYKIHVINVHVKSTQHAYLEAKRNNIKVYVLPLVVAPSAVVVVCLGCVALSVPCDDLGGLALFQVGWFAVVVVWCDAQVVLGTSVMLP